MQIIFITIIFLIFSCVFKTDAEAQQQSNFNIMPSPIAFPYFKPDRYDGKVDASFINITADELTLSGGFADLKGRYALSEYFAIDGEFGMGGLQGTMPGIPPFSLNRTKNGTPYIYRIDGKGEVSMFMLRMSTNLEIQLMHTDSFSFIVFGGPNLSLNNMSISTPYSLIVPPGYTNTGQVSSGFTNKLTIVSSMSGGQFGIQMDINSPETGIRLSPFFIMSSFSGSATLTDDPGSTGASSTTLSAQIPSTTSTAFGLDIIFGNISIGTILQQLTSQQQQQGSSNTNIFMISAGYYFSNAEEQKSSK